MLETSLLLFLLFAFIWSAWSETVWIGLVGMFIAAIAAKIMGVLPNFDPDPLTFFLLPLLGLSIGTLWSFWKWRRHMRSDFVQSRLRYAKKSYDRNTLQDVPFKESSTFPNCARASQNIGRIVSWIILWPFSMLVYLLEDVMVEIGRWIYNRFATVYMRITDSALPEDMR